MIKLNVLIEHTHMIPLTCVDLPVTLSAKWRDILIAVWRPQSVHS